MGPNEPKIVAGHDRFVFYSMLTVGALTGTTGLLELAFYPRQYWQPLTAILSCLLYIRTAFLIRKGVPLQKFLIPLTITGVPYLSMRILLTKGLAGSITVWYAIFPFYMMLFGWPKWRRWAMAYVAVGFFATYLIQEYYGSYFYAEFNMYPSFLAHFLTLTVIFSLAVHVQLYEALRRRHESTIRAQKEALESSRRLATVGELAGGVAHEVNNPLATLQLVAEMLKDSPESWSDKLYMNQQLDKILNVVERISLTVNSLLRFSRRRSGADLMPESIEKLIQEAVILNSFRIKTARVNLQVNFHGFEKSEIFCRPDEFSQVLMALLVNAIEAAEKAPKPWVSIDYSEQGEYFTLAISNSGSKIASDVASRMFDPYFTTKEFGKGPGLGLSVALGVVQSHGGALIHDTNSKNTTFKIKMSKISKPIAEVLGKPGLKKLAG